MTQKPKPPGNADSPAKSAATKNPEGGPTQHPNVTAYLAENAATPAAARATLQRLGINQADGKLTKPYR